MSRTVEEEPGAVDNLAMESNTEKGNTMCQTCNAPPTIIHYADCPSANRAQRLGISAQDEMDRRVGRIVRLAGEAGVPLTPAAADPWTYDKIIAREA